MSKTSGLGQRLLWAAVDVSGDIGSIDGIHGGPALLDVTGIDKSAMERIGGLRDGGLEFTSYFNPSAGAAHPTFSALPTVDVVVSYLTGTTLGVPAAGLVAKQIDYAPKRGSDGSFTMSISAEADGFGLEWGVNGTAGLRTDAAATNGASVDAGVLVGTTAFGLQLYVQLVAFTGTSVTIKVQSSTDDAVGDPYSDVTGATTGALSAAGAVRIATASNASVERYLRVVTTGTFSNAQFHVAIMRNLTATAF